MKILKFSYQRYNGLWLLLINVKIGLQPLLYPALVDSGAIISLFNAKIAKTLGIEFKQGKKRHLNGIKGIITAYEHLIPMTIEDVSFDCKIAFSDELEINMNLLGKDNFFDRFIISFDRTAKIIRLEKKDENNIYRS